VLGTSDRSRKIGWVPLQRWVSDVDDCDGCRNTDVHRRQPVNGWSARCREDRWMPNPCVQARAASPNEQFARLLQRQLRRRTARKPVASVLVFGLLWSGPPAPSSRRRPTHPKRLYRAPSRAPSLDAPTFPPERTRSSSTPPPSNRTKPASSPFTPAWPHHPMPLRPTTAQPSRPSRTKSSPNSARLAPSVSPPPPRSTSSSTSPATSPPLPPSPRSFPCGCSTLAKAPAPSMANKIAAWSARRHAARARIVWTHR